MTRAAIVLLFVVAGCGDDTTPTAADLAVADDLTIGGDMVELKPECDVFANTGCAAGQKCTVGTQNGTPRDLCFAISAVTVDEGAACMSVADGSGRTGDNCAPGLICLDFPGDGPHCRKPCFVRGALRRRTSVRADHADLDATDDRRRHPVPARLRQRRRLRSGRADGLLG